MPRRQVRARRSEPRARHGVDRRRQPGGRPGRSGHSRRIRPASRPSFLCATAASRCARQRAKRLAWPGRSSSAEASASRRKASRAAFTGSSGDGGGRRRNGALKSGTEMRGTLLAAAGRAQPPFQGRSGSSSGSGGTRRARFSDGIGIPARPAVRRVMRFGFGLRGRGRRQHQAARHHDDEPPRRRFGRAQQPEHGAVKMARQGGCRGSPALPWRRAWPARASAPRGSSRSPHSSPSPPPSSTGIIAPVGKGGEKFQENDPDRC